MFTQHAILTDYIVPYMSRWRLSKTAYKNKEAERVARLTGGKI